MSAALAAPLAMGYGMFAFVALGDQYFVHGVLAGLVTAAVVAIANVVLGDRSAHVYAPRITTNFLIGSLLFHLLQLGGGKGDNADLAAALAALLCIVLLGGALQFLFGLVRLGTVIKFVPHPVMAGFQNAAALLLFLVQLANVMGFERSVPFMQALAHVSDAKPASLLVAAVAMAVVWKGRRIAPDVPPVLLGLAAGTIAYYALVWAGFRAGLGPVIGGSDIVRWRDVISADVAGLWDDFGARSMVTTIVSGALALAIIASLDALLCAKLLSRPGDPKIDGNRLLMRLGIGNMISAACGGMTSGLNLGPSHLNRAYGGRTPVSVLVNALVLLLTAGVLFPIAGYLPRAVLSAVIMVIAVQHVDAWTVRTARRVFSETTAYRRKIALDLLVVAVVATLSIVVNIITAVFIGIAIAVLLFLMRMSRSIVRRAYTGRDVRSRKARSLQEMTALERVSGSIVILELHGPLFFGTAETLDNVVSEKIGSGTRHLVLDLRRVTEIDSAGARVLQDMHAELATREIQLLIAVAQPSATAEALADYGAVEAVSSHRLFADVDRAIEWAEDHLLGDTESDALPEIAAHELSIFSGFRPQELAVMQAHLTRTTFPAKSTIFRQGDPGSGVFFIAKGTASAFLHTENSRDVRLASFATDTVFGELAILDPNVRSATVIADTDLVCYALSVVDFTALSEGASPVALKLLANLARMLSRRLREATRSINQLEQ